MSAKVKGPSQKELFEARKAAKIAQDAATAQAEVAAKASVEAEKAKHALKFAKEKAKVSKQVEKNKEFISTVKARMATMTSDEIQLEIKTLMSQASAMERNVVRDGRGVGQAVSMGPTEQKKYDELMLRRTILEGKLV